MKVLCCNIRYFGAQDGENSWPYRREICLDVIQAQAPDIICFQEMWAEQFDEMRAAIPAFASFGVVDEPCGRRPMNSIFYHSALFRRISAGGYWLSETPHVTGSRSWSSNNIRLANWLRLEHIASHSEFRIINTHLDHVSQLAREKQANMIVEDAHAYPSDYPQILTGDMNCDHENQAILKFKAGGWRDTYHAVHGTENPGPTFHGFLGPDYASDLGKIDWIFFKGGADVLDAHVIRESRDGRYPSDHYFVSAEFSFNSTSNQEARANLTTKTQSR
jgi:endonuclease/exonuclease/phosphatase family metal-dependent hydrolase